MLPPVRWSRGSSGAFAGEQSGTPILALPHARCATLGESLPLVGLSILTTEMGFTILQSEGLVR